MIGKLVMYNYRAYKHVVSADVTKHNDLGIVLNSYYSYADTVLEVYWFQKKYVSEIPIQYAVML